MQRHLIKYLLLFFLLVHIGGLVWFVVYRPSTVNSTITKPLHSKTIFTTQAINSSLYKEGQLIETIGADDITVQSRRFGLFRIRNMNEMVISNLSVEFNLLNNEDDTAEPQSLLCSIEKAFQGPAGNAHRSSPLGYITSVTIKGFNLVTRSSLGEVSLECQAARGEMKSKSKRLNLFDLVLIQPQNDLRIVAKQAYWDEEVSRFEIPGAYRQISPSGVKLSTGLSVDLNFNCNELD